MPTTTINWLALVQVLISIMIPVIMFIVTAIYNTGLRQRTEILSKLDDISKHQYDLETRLSILEHDFADIDPHPSRHKRPAV